MAGFLRGHLHGCSTRLCNFVLIELLKILNKLGNFSDPVFECMNYLILGDISDLEYT